MDDEKLDGGMSALTEVLWLKPCPFCGGSAEFDIGDVRSVGLMCVDCGMLGPQFDVETDDRDRPIARHVVIATAKAIGHWNARHNEPS